jgi:hypothetical protein
MFLLLIERYADLKGEKTFAVLPLLTNLNVDMVATIL